MSPRETATMRTTWGPVSLRVFDSGTHASALEQQCRPGAFMRDSKNQLRYEISRSSLQPIA